MGKIINKHPINYHKLKFDYKWQMERFDISEGEAKEKILRMRKNLGDSDIFSIQWNMKKYDLSYSDASDRVQDLKIKIRNNIRNRSDFDFKAMSPKNKEHWMKKGLNINDSIEKANMQVKHMQKAFIKKKKENPEKYLNSYNTKIEYWLEKTGGNEELAIKLLGERQATNTLARYIKTHGDAGYEKWKKRNKEWSAIMEEKYKNGEYSKETPQSYSFRVGI